MTLLDSSFFVVINVMLMRLIRRSVFQRSISFTEGAAFVPSLKSHSRFTCASMHPEMHWKKIQAIASKPHSHASTNGASTQMFTQRAIQT